ncbi:MAG: YkgJ family cysteine cluster protein [Thermoanaerobaculia bacterium]|nr:YkgJ family cysteine cluster protein [Thermoanaerobaculia bacterium]
MTARRQFDCNNCPAYCCSYDHIEVTDRDLARLAGHFELAESVAERRFTKRVEGGRLRVLRHTADKHFGTACRFLDRETRQCTIYHARPAICRSYPGTGRCGFYDFLCSERRSQDDPEYVPSFTRG